MSENRKNPSPIIRWFVLLLISLAMFGNYFVFDIVSPLADLLKAQLSFSDENIGLLNAIYSFPNIIMVFIGGLIIDRIGARKALIIFTLLVATGAAITSTTGTIYVMASGRLIFGLGAESMIVAITTLVAKWFKGKELSFAFGLNLTVARLGSFLALNSPTWAKSLFDYWQKPFLLAALIGIFSLICVILYYFLEIYLEKRYSFEAKEEAEIIELKDVLRYQEKNRLFLFAGALFIFAILVAIFPQSWSILLVALILFSLTIFINIKSFSKSFWFISALCVTFYSAMFPFQTFAIKFFMDVHNQSREVGGNLSSILTLAAMIFTPMFGLLADKLGKRSLLMLIGSFLIIPVYLMMAYKVDIATTIGLSGGLKINIEFFDINAVIPYYLMIPMAMMGIAFSLIPAVMWPSVALITESSKLGSAYGLMTMIQNIGLFAFNLIIGYSNDLFNASASNPSGYIPGMWIFTILGFLGITFAILLKQSAKKEGYHALEEPGK
jgi:MFS family permease